ncbi:AzlD domain-containing protein [Actinoplanes sp. Pm04-4]|uniref:AzlD domain-containing protein n=1 Tax=Paractinoplanes pyxinae TaxID=2997416 RepID=A0ABT4ASA9_9ACTN|nr:AzlD domain-containing protein [Actinoplanes pyxinae]MCY1137126.1 AzlD domain-containing protein [Actinoplanes pyxinae]
MMWLVILAAAAGTLALRLSFLVAGRHLKLPAWTTRITDLVFPVAIAALLGATLRGVATGGLGDFVALLAGMVVTGLIARRGRSILLAMGAGLATVFVTGLIAVAFAAGTP